MGQKLSFSPFLGGKGKVALSRFFVLFGEGAGVRLDVSKVQGLDLCTAVALQPASARSNDSLGGYGGVACLFALGFRV